MMIFHHSSTLHKSDATMTKMYENSKLFYSSLTSTLLTTYFTIPNKVEMRNFPHTNMLVFFIMSIEK